MPRHSFSRMSSLAVGVSMAVLALSIPVQAVAETEKGVDPRDVVVFTNLIAAGHTPRYMGFDKAIGFHVWFVRQDDGTPAIFYTTLNGQGVLAPGPANLVGGDYYVVRDGKIVNITYDYYIIAKTILATDGAGRSQTTAVSPPGSPAPIPAASGGAPVVAPVVAVPSVPKVETAPVGGVISGAAMLAAFEGAHWIEFGDKAAPLIYVVADPECPYCHAFWQTIRPYIARGAVRVRLIVEGVVNGDRSVAAATLILSAPDGRASWNDYIDGKPIPPMAQEVVAQGATKLRDNLVMWKTVLYDRKIGGVPLILWRNKAGKLGYNLGPEPREIPALIDGLTAISSTR